MYTFRVNDEMCEHGKWLVCHGGEQGCERSQRQFCKVKLEITHTSMFKCSNGVVWNRVDRAEAKIDCDGKGWPDAEVLPDKSFGCAANFEIETVW